ALMSTVTRQSRPGRPQPPEHPEPSESSTSLSTTMMRRILASSFLGSMIEFYDFILFATASSFVFNEVFFVNLPSTLGLFLSFTILAVGYVARPLGGVIFGHFGDRVGRKAMLVIAMVLMGCATFII